MDHIPEPREPVSPHRTIPSLSQRPHNYDGLDWKPFPKRQGWKVNIYGDDTPILVRSPKPSRKETSAFLQGWLFFGLIKEFFGVCGIYINLDQFHQVKQSQHIVTTVQLSKYTALLRLQEQLVLPIIRSEHAERAFRVLQHIEHCTNQTLSGGQRAHEIDLKDDIAESIVISANTLQHINSHIWPEAAFTRIAFSSHRLEPLIGLWMEDSAKAKLT
jgi:hypothetical protein